MLGLYLDIRIIGHTVCRMLSSYEINCKMCCKILRQIMCCGQTSRITTIAKHTSNHKSVARAGH